LGPSLGLGKDAKHEAEAKDAKDEVEAKDPKDPKHAAQPHAAVQAQAHAGPDSIQVQGLQDESQTADYAARLRATQRTTLVTTPRAPELPATQSPCFLLPGPATARLPTAMTV